MNVEMSLSHLSKVDLGMFIGSILNEYNNFGRTFIQTVSIQSSIDRGNTDHQFKSLLIL